MAKNVTFIGFTAAMLLGGATAAYAAPPAKAVANAAAAGINLLNTIMSNAGVGNGADGAEITGVTTTTTTDEMVLADTNTIVGETTTSTETSATSSSVTGDFYVFNNNGKCTEGAGTCNLKRDTTTTTTTTSITTSSTPITTESLERTDTYETTVTTTTYQEIDPGKSVTRNNAPEGGEVDPLVESTTQLVSEGAWQVVGTETTFNVEVSDAVVTVTEEVTSEVCNPGNQICM